jgi:hypothetical protein
MKQLIKSMMIFSMTLLCYQFNAQTQSDLVISADNMNIFYIGIENPVSIAVPGIQSENLKVSIDEGIITGSNGKYTVLVSKPGEVIISVYIKSGVDKYEKYGTKSFRVKRIPSPIISDPE